MRIKPFLCLLAGALVVGVDCGGEVQIGEVEEETVTICVQYSNITGNNVSFEGTDKYGNILNGSQVTLGPSTQFPVVANVGQLTGFPPFTFRDRSNTIGPCNFIIVTAGAYVYSVEARDNETNLTCNQEESTACN